MKKKWLIALGVVLAMLLGVVAIVAMNIDTWLDENRPMIEGEASAALGRPVTLGALGVQFWGGVGVRIEQVRIAEDPTYGEGALLTLDRGVVRVAILPALLGRIEIGEVVLEAPQIRVIRDARGLSIDSLVAADETAEPEEATGGPDLSVSEVRIEGGRFVFEDRLAGDTVESVIDGVDVSLHDVGAERPLSFELAASVLGAESPNLHGEGTAGPVLAAAGTPLRFDVEFHLDALSIDDVMRIEDIAATLPDGTDLGGQLDARLSASGVPDDAAFDLALDATRLDVAMASDFVKPAGVPLKLTARGHARPDEALVEAWSFRLSTLVLAGDAKVALDDVGAFDASIRGDAVPLAGWGTLLPALEGMPVEGLLGVDLRARGATSSDALPRLEGEVTLADTAVRMPDTPAVEQLTGRALFDGSAVAVRDTRFELGGAGMSLQADVPDLNAPQVSFVVEAPVLPLAALGVIEPGTEADDQLRDLRMVGGADLRTEALQADVRFASPAGRLQAIDYTRLEGRASVAGALMRLDELSVKMLGGEVQLSGTLDENDAAHPLYDGHIRLADVSIEEVVQSQLPAIGRAASGRINTSLAFGAGGLDTDALLGSLTGRGGFDVRDGTLHDFNLADEALRGATGVPGLSSLLSASVRERHPSLFSTADTHFEAVRAGIEIIQGQLRTDDFVLDAADFGLTGGGTVGLNGSLDLSTTFATSPSLASSLVSAAKPAKYLLDSTGRIVIPVEIEGTLSSPRVKTDSKFISSALTRAAVDTVGSVVSGLLGGSERKASKGSAPAGTGSESPATPETAPIAPQPGEEAADPAQDLEGEIKKGIEGLFGN